MNILVFDIETIPQQAPLSDIQKEELDRKMVNYLSKHPDADEEETKRLLMGTSPYFGEIICIGLGYRSEQTDLTTRALIGPEKSILDEFWKVLSKFKGTFVSYNGLDFDVFFVSSRTMKHQIRVTNRSFLETRRYQTSPHFDVKQIVSDWDRFRSVTLHLLCDHLGVPSPKEGEIKAKDVAQAYADGRIDEIADYCIRDIVSTYGVYNIVKNYTKNQY